MSCKCDYCASTHYRLSRFRASDVLNLVAFQYPIRCLQCGERSYANLIELYVARQRKERA